MLEDDEGHRIAALPAGALRGAVDHVSATATELTVSGWAGTTRPPRPADRIVAFAGNRFLSSVTPSGRRPDLARIYGDGLGQAGFTIVGAPDRRGSAASRLRVFAILGDRAAQISVVPPG
jgi:hypothetical protein